MHGKDYHDFQGGCCKAKVYPELTRYDLQGCIHTGKGNTIAMRKRHLYIPQVILETQITWSRCCFLILTNGFGGDKATTWKCTALNIFHSLCGENLYFFTFTNMVYSALASFIISTAMVLYMMHRINVFHKETSMGKTYHQDEINMATWIFVINAIIHAVWILFVW